MEETPKPWIRPSQAASALYMNAGWDLSMSRAHLGVDAIHKESLASTAVALSFIKRNPELANAFAERAGIDVEKWMEALDRDHPVEPQPEPRQLPPNATEEDRKSFELMREMEDERKASGEPAPFTKPLKVALRKAREDTRAAGNETFTLGQLAAALHEVESNAATVFGQVAHPARIQTALDWLKEQPDPDNAELVIAQRGSMNQMIEKLWPKIREETAAMVSKSKGKQTLDEFREKDYAEHPERYNQPFDIFARLSKEVPDEQRFSHRTGSWMRAAANEARIRHAPEVKLDHLFYALLQVGSDTSAFLDNHGVDRTAWRRVVDEELPRFEDGPRWPPNARDLGMHIPDGKERTLKKEIPDDLDVSKLTKEERREYVEIRPSGIEFTDIMWLLGSTCEEQTIGFRLLAGAGITEDNVKAELKLRETGDPNWYKIRPELVNQLRDPKPRVMGANYSQMEAVELAAQFEARQRWAPRVEFGHVLLAILVDGTDTSNLLDSMGINRSAIITEIDALLPKYDSGPMFPPSDVGSFVIEMILGGEGNSSDLKVLAGVLRDRAWMLKSDDRPALDILVGRGLTIGMVQDRLKELGISVFEA